MKSLIFNPWLWLGLILAAALIWSHGNWTGSSRKQAEWDKANIKATQQYVTVRKKQNEVRNSRPDIDVTVKRLRSRDFNPQGRAP